MNKLKHDGRIYLGGIFSCPTCLDATLPYVNDNCRYFIPAEHSPESGTESLFRNRKRVGMKISILLLFMYVTRALQIDTNTSIQRVLHAAALVCMAGAGGASTASAPPAARSARVGARGQV